MINIWKCRRKTLKMQKESFWDAKGFVLDCKRSPFTMQKEPFWNVKGLLFVMTYSAADVSF